MIAVFYLYAEGRFFAVYHKGITREMIILTAAELTEKYGLDKFSMHLLAETLGVKTASLYKHVSGMDEVITETGLYALSLQQEEQLKAVSSLHGDEAVAALAWSYRKFALDHPGLYRVIMSMPNMSNELLEKKAVMITEPIMQVLDDYDLNVQEKIHWQRVLRSIMHGFVAHEEAGYFSHFPADREESYKLCIDSCISALNSYIMSAK